MTMMQEWLLDAFERQMVTLEQLREASIHSWTAKKIWMDFSDDSGLVEDCQEQIKDFLSEMDDVI